MQQPSQRALDGANTIEPTTYGRVPTPAVLHLVHPDRLPAPTFYTRHGKRAIDLVGASVLLLILAIPMLVIAGFVHATSPGGPFYSQARLGYHRTTFRCRKFRTMVHDADIILIQNPQLRDAMAVSWKLPDDPRITGIGKFLRAHSIDEIPQLFNVLLGHMSLVGPRPYMPHELEGELGHHAIAITSVRPGMTGLWQVSGRANLTPASRITLDEEYVQCVTFREDMRLLFRTVKVVCNRHGAY